MWARRSCKLVTFVALKSSLLNKLLGLQANGTVVSICKLALLAHVNRPPSRSHVDAAADANLVAGFPSVRRRLLLVAVCDSDPV